MRSEINQEEDLVTVQLPSGHEIYYVNTLKLSQILRDRGFTNDIQLQNIAHSDLTPGVYEGGLKVWESSIDLCEYIDSLPSPISFAGKEILELGCGAGLPTIVAFQKGAKSALLQDYNNSVIECFTKSNLAANNVSISNCKFFSGDWSDMRKSLNDLNDLKMKIVCKYDSDWTRNITAYIIASFDFGFDVILTAETIYNEENYGELYDVIADTLAEDGTVLIAAKAYYFGVGGSVVSFMEFVKNKGQFDCSIKWKSKSSIPRKILEMRWKTNPQI